jgi:hypothetical protein
VKTPYRRRNAITLVATAASAGTLAAAGALAALAVPASAQPASAGTAHVAVHAFTVRQITSGARLHHKFRMNGTGAFRTEALAGPDDITMLGRHLFVGFQNSVGSQGEVSPSGNFDSTVVEFTLSGREIAQWDVKGKDDGLTADPVIGKLIVTVNEDSKSSLYTIAPSTGKITHYSYSEPLPHRGGTDAISVYRGKILVTASAPGTSGKAPANAPAVYAVTLAAPVAPGSAHVAVVRPLFADDATAIAANGSKAGKQVTLALTDPDSSSVVPGNSPRFGGDFMLDSQGDLELIFFSRTGLKELSLPASVDDSAWAVSRSGALFTTDAKANTVDIILGTFRPGTAYTAVTPCNANSAPATCPGPGFPPNFLGTINLGTGALTKVVLAGAPVQPKGLIFVPWSR